jgi:hypothetical protein
MITHNKLEIALFLMLFRVTKLFSGALREHTLLSSSMIRSSFMVARR